MPSHPDRVRKNYCEHTAVMSNANGIVTCCECKLEMTYDAWNANRNRLPEITKNVLDSEPEY